MAEAEADPDAKWDKTEAYFVSLGQRKKFELRGQVWLFYLNFE